MLNRIYTLLKSIPHVGVWYMIIYLISVASIVDIPGAPVFAMSKLTQAIFIISIAALKTSVLILIAAWLWRYRTGRIISIILLILYASAATVNIVSYGFYGFGMSRKLIALVAQTNAREATEFIPDMFSHLVSLFTSLRLWIFAIAAIAVYWILSKLPRTAVIAGASVLSIAGLCMYSWIFFSYSTGKTSIFMSLRIPKYFHDQHRWDAEMQKRIDNKMSLPNPETVRSEKSAANVVVIIGESSNRSNLSIYGFPLETTPYMDSMSDSLVVFTDAIASSLLTSSNLERILSFKADDRVYGDWYNYPSVIDLFNVAGYNTYWLSNQERAGVWSNATGALASGADVMRFVGMEYCDDTLLSDRTYDDALIPVFDKALTDSAEHRMVFVHLLGSHVIYENRFPPERALFDSEDILSTLDRPWLNNDGAQLLADYSNSLVFTDSIWHEIAMEVARNPEPSILIYLSDHGEKVCVGDNGRARDSRSAEIPFVLYANKAYREANREIMKRLEAAKDRPFTSAATVYMLMTLTGTDYGMYNGADDPLSDEFKARTRFVDEEPWPHDHEY